MSGLRYFGDLMHEAIAADRRLRQITANAADYRARCELIRRESLPTGERPNPSFHAATEGINAVRIITS